MRKMILIEIIVLSFLASIVLCGCTTHLTKKGESVRVTDNISDVEDCECLGQIRIRSRGDSTLTSDKLAQVDINQINKLRNKTAKMGGDVGLLRVRLCYTGFYMIGEAYLCNGANDIKTTSDD